MPTSLTIICDSANLPAALGADLAAAVDLAKAEKAASTRRAYGTDFRIFREWCDARGVAALPAAPETVAAYLAARATTSKASTLGRRVAAIRYAHKLAGLALPTDAEGVKATMRGIRRTYGSARVRKAPAVAGKMLSMVVATAPDKLAGLRDRALLLIGFGGALRRSELVALDVADIEETETGLLVTIRGSKTDQKRVGATIAIARGDVACPSKALRAWLDAAGIEAGPIFRPIDKGGTVRDSRLTDRSVANIVKAYAGRAGFDANTFSGHSLRAGFLTSAAGKGASIFKMMDVSRHRSVDTLRGYVRDAELFKDHAGAGLL